MGRGKEDEELIKIAVRDKIKNIHEVWTHFNDGKN